MVCSSLYFNKKNQPGKVVREHPFDLLQQVFIVSIHDTIIFSHGEDDLSEISRGVIYEQSFSHDNPNS